MNVYDFQVADRSGGQVPLSNYRGKVILIMNSATECGFTPQYEELQKMYERIGGEDFVILDFPCNQFGNQAPGSSREIADFCSSRYGVTFPIFSKIEVNGENSAPLFQYLKGKKGFDGFDPGHKLTPVLEDMLGKDNPDYKKSPDIKWNFTKFLIDREGNVVARFEPTRDLAEVEREIKKLL